MSRCRWLSPCLFALALLSPGCADDTDSSATPGSLSVALEVGGGADIHEVAYTVSGNGIDPISGSIDTSAPGATASVEVFGLPPGDGYVVSMTATTVDGELACSGSTEFAVQVGLATNVGVYLNCKPAPRYGGVRVNGEFNRCAELTKVVVSPLRTSMGSRIDLAASASDAESDSISYQWGATGGAIADPNEPETNYACTVPGPHTIFVAASDGPTCIDEWSVDVMCEDDGGGGGLSCTADSDCAFPPPLCRAFPTCSAEGVCEAGDPLPSGTPCRRGGTCTSQGVCRLPFCIEDADCTENNPPVECREGWRCVLDGAICNAGEWLPDGTPCSNGAGTCSRGECVGESTTVSQIVRVTCSNSITSDISVLPSLLAVTGPLAWKDDPTEPDTWRFGGEAVFQKDFLDAASTVIPGGVRQVNLVDLKWTVQLRSGGTMNDVPLTLPPSPYTCTIDRSVACDPADDLPSVPGRRANPVCEPMGTFNPCGRFVDLPISEDCEPDGLCNSLSVSTAQQCEYNGFCVTEQLRIPLQEQNAQVTPEAPGGLVTFGWHEFPNRGFNPDGTYVLPAATFAAPIGPVGFRATASGLSVAVECMLGGDQGVVPFSGPYPVDDRRLLQYPVPEP